jgi:hypothetical protein
MQGFSSLLSTFSPLLSIFSAGRRKNRGDWRTTFLNGTFPEDLLGRALACSRKFTAAEFDEFASIETFDPNNSEDIRHSGWLLPTKPEPE